MISCDSLWLRKSVIWCQLWIWLIAFIKSIKLCLIFHFFSLDFVLFFSAFSLPWEDRVSHIHIYISAYRCFFLFKICIERYVGRKRQKKNGKGKIKQRDVYRRKRDALNRICLIKSIVILINSTENCHRYCHDLRFFCCFGIETGMSTFFWHFYMRFFAHS